MNYEELVKSLRMCSGNTAEPCDCDKCPERDKIIDDGICADYTECVDALMVAAADAIEELQAQLMYSNDAAKSIAEKIPKWIPVTERLPEPMTDVVLFMRYGTYKQLSQIAVGYWDSSLKDFNYCDVTHWMPLPEPPKESTAYESIKTGLEQAISGEYREETAAKEETECKRTVLS